MLPQADLLVSDVEGQLSDDVCEGSLMHAKGLDSLFIAQGFQDNLFLPVIAGMGPELVLNGLEVLPEHPSIHGILDVFILVSHIEVGDLVQDAC